LIQMLQMRTMMLQPTMIKTISNGPAGSDHWSSDSFVCLHAIE
jgi:hypothetical protein